MSKQKFDLAIIGAGVVGLATALEFIQRHPDLSLIVLDKESQVAAHQTGHNSGVIHSGIYYKPGSLKARLCVEGAAAMVRFCQQHDIPHEICGKLVVATSEKEFAGLQTLYDRGTANGVPGLRMLTAEEAHELEPHALGLRGLHVPGTGITDYAAVTSKYADLVRQHGGEIMLRSEVVGLRQMQQSVVLQTTTGECEASSVVNCAGLHSDRITRMAGADANLRIVPFRGEYYEIAPEKHYMVKGLIYPVPDPQFPFLGVHFTRRIGGGVEAGPNAVLAFKREGYTKTSFNVRDLADTLTFGGFWTLARKHWKSAMGEYYRSWSKLAFLKALRKLMPELSSADLVPGGAGVRAQALEYNGSLVDDFRFIYTDRMVHVCNVPSPAATASLVIGREIVNNLEERLGLDRTVSSLSL